MFNNPRQNQSQGGVMTDDKKPREFYLYSRGPSYYPDIFKLPLKSENMPEGLRYYVPSSNIWTSYQDEIHVIEYSAYDREHELAVEADSKRWSAENKLSACEAKLKICVETMKDVIRNSHDIVAKKRCSEALAKITASENEK
jgi:hypothetical protein